MIKTVWRISYELRWSVSVVIKCPQSRHVFPERFLFRGGVEMTRKDGKMPEMTYDGPTPIQGEEWQRVCTLLVREAGVTRTGSPESLK